MSGSAHTHVENSQLDSCASTLDEFGNEFLCTSSAVNANGTQQAAASGFPDPGFLQVSGVASADWHPNPGNFYVNGASSFARVSIFDTVTITALGLVGSNAEVHYKFGLRGQLTGGVTLGEGGSGTAAAFLVSTITVNGHSFENAASRSTAGDTNSVNGFDENPFGLFHPVVPIVLGTQFLLAMDLQAGASVSGVTGGDVRASAEYLRDALFWAGIESITVDGVPVDYTLTSASGTDWRQSLELPPDVAPPIPEPATNALMLAALGALALRRYGPRLTLCT